MDRGPGPGRARRCSPGQVSRPVATNYVSVLMKQLTIGNTR
ncbi:MAG TPA: hypothetical protein VFO62_03385 [Candidatus Binatia bacterium]|nr:hypothetical protein [Candidatus Binatia bacterium]